MAPILFLLRLAIASVCESGLLLPFVARPLTLGHQIFHKLLARGARGRQTGHS